MKEFASFSFSTVPQLISETGAARQLGQHIAARFPSARRALLVTDPGFLATGLVEAPMHDLEKHNIAVHLYSDVVADPPEAVVQHAVAFARKRDIDIVIGLGGGSSMDVAKLIAVLAAGDQPLKQIYGIGNVKGERLPLVQVPTTAGTGS
ncbi:MAG TPA: iron-containing alcohol dehydrogenase, partial [Telluria sp.]|nr:iron-containing alcohol dehydrogenase [Telluria sp.]